MIIVTTNSGAQVWVAKDQLAPSAETISYNALKAGDEYTDKDGVVQKRKSAGNEFVGCGKQVVKKYDSKSILDHLIAQGITPTFSLS